MVTLRPFSPPDIPRLLGWIDSFESLVQWAGPVQFTFPLTAEQFYEYLKDCRGENPSRHAFVALDDRNTEYGHIELGSVNPGNGTASLCRVLVSPDARGKGLSLPMVQQALRFGFQDLGLRRIDLRVFSFNTAAIRCYEKAGFVREGLLRKSQKVGEQYWDTVLMAMLREESYQ
jgi:RimJ/RimL family protein N-acetyltransferase